MAYFRPADLLCSGLAILALFTAACDSPSPTNTASVGGGKNEHTVFSDTTEWDWVANPGNPYNLAGQIHNRALDYADDHTSANVTETSIEWKEAARDFFISEGLFNADSANATFIASINVTQPYLRMDSLTVLYNAAYNGAGLSTAERNALNAIFTAVDSNETLQATITALSTVEADIMNSSMTTAQKCLPLYVVAIAKYSTAYWYPISSGRAAQGDPSGSGLLKTAKTESNAHKVIKADLVGSITGAVGGFLTGGTIGFFTGLATGGPAGAIAGAAGGAMLGSAGGAVGGGVTGSMSKGFELANAPSGGGKVTYGGNKKKP